MDRTIPGRSFIEMCHMTLFNKFSPLTSTTHFTSTHKMSSKVSKKIKFGKNMYVVSSICCQYYTNIAKKSKPHTGIDNSTCQIRKYAPSVASTDQYASENSDESDNAHVGKSELQDLDTEKIGRKIKLPVTPAQIDLAKSAAKKPRFDYVERYKFGLTAIASAVFYEEDKDKGSVASQFGEGDFRIIAVQILAAMSRAVLKGCIEGNLAAKSRTNNKLKELYQETSLRSMRGEQRYSGIYIRYLVNADTREASAPKEWLNVTAVMMKYVSGNQESLALELDNMSSRRNSTLESIQAGRYWHLDGHRHHVMTIVTFCEAIKRDTETMNEEEIDKPMRSPAYVGYSMTINRRLEQHQRRENSSWFQHFVHDAFRYVFGDKAFVFDNFVVCYLLNGPEAIVDETLIGRIFNSTYDTGGGFSIVQGGVQVSGAFLSNLSKTDKANMLKDCEDFRYSKDIVEYSEAMQQEGIRAGKHLKKPFGGAGLTQSRLEMFLERCDEAERKLDEKKELKRLREETD
jgi:hypothetical protein